MVYARFERDLGRLERIIGAKRNVQVEYAALVNAAVRAENRREPLVQIVAFGARAAVGRRIERYFG